METTAQLANTPGWLCPMCGLRSTQINEVDYIRHIESLHKHELAEQRMSGNADEWTRHAVKQAFSQIYSKQDEPSPHVPAPVSSSFNVDIQKLTISNASLQSLPDSLHSTRGSAPPLEGRQTPRRGVKTPNTSRLRRSGQTTRDFHRDAQVQRTNSRGSDDGNTTYKHKSPTTASTRSPTASPRQAAPPQRPRINLPIDKRWPDMFMQPDSRPISYEQLAKEVKSIYAGLTMVESKVMNLDKSRSESQEKLTPEVWKAMISVHRALLNEHHDFFLASQHPSAGPNLHKLALKYNMPARMWKHGIHSLLELLRHHLPSSLEFMIQFIYIAYQMVCLLLETVPSFTNTWIECLGDISRYRMAIEEEEPRDRDIWAHTARYWYCKAADLIPQTGRLYHHLAILARPNALQQLYLYSRSLISEEPFLGSRDTMEASLLGPILGDHPAYLPEVEIVFIRVVAGVFHRSPHQDGQHYRRFLELLPHQINKVATKWREQGVYIAVTLIACLQDFGNESYLTQLLQLALHLSKPKPDDADGQAKYDERTNQLQQRLDSHEEESFQFSCNFLQDIINIILRQEGDLNVVPFLHIILSFVGVLVSVSKTYESALTKEHLTIIRSITAVVDFPRLSNFLNQLPKDNVGSRYESHEFVRPDKGLNPLPEDFLIWGIQYASFYLPPGFFDEASMDEERTIEHASTVVMRTERVLYISYGLVCDGYMGYNFRLKSFNEGSGITDRTRDGMDLTTSTAPVPSSDTTSSPVTVDPKTTTLIVDIDVIKEQQTMEFILQRGFRLVIPVNVMEKLQLESIKSDPRSSASHMIVELIRTAARNQKKIQILDQNGGDVTTKALEKDLQSGQIHQEDEDQDANITVGIARRATEDLQKEKQTRFNTSGPPSSQTSPHYTDGTQSSAVLLTDSENVKRQAFKADVRAVAGKLFKQKLVDRS